MFLGGAGEGIELMLISWNTTQACNIHCQHCYRDAGDCQRDELTTAEGKKLLEEVGVVTMMKYIFGGAAVTGLIVSSIIGWDAPLLTDALHGEWHWVPWAVLAFVLVFPTYLSYFLVPVGLKYLKTTVVAMYSYLILVVTTVVSLTLGQDRFSWTQAAAIAMICISVYFVEVAEAKK